VRGFYGTYSKRIKPRCSMSARVQPFAKFHTLSCTNFALFFEVSRTKTFFRYATKDIYMSSPSGSWQGFVNFGLLVPKFCARVCNFFLVSKNMLRTKHFPLTCNFFFQTCQIENCRARVCKLFFVCKNMSRRKHFSARVQKKVTHVKPLGDLPIVMKFRLLVSKFRARVCQLLQKHVAHETFSARVQNLVAQSRAPRRVDNGCEVFTFGSEIFCTSLQTFF
jgi:hypothetical protein